MPRIAKKKLPASRIGGLRVDIHTAQMVERDLGRDVYRELAEYVSTDRGLKEFVKHRQLSVVARRLVCMQQLPPSVRQLFVFNELREVPCKWLSVCFTAPEKVSLHDFMVAVRNVFSAEVPVPLDDVLIGVVRLIPVVRTSAPVVRLGRIIDMCVDLALRASRGHYPPAVTAASALEAVCDLRAAAARDGETSIAEEGEKQLERLLQCVDDLYDQCGL